MIKQRTIQKMVKAVGVGLHTGKRVELRLIPAEANKGITYIRTDLKPAVEFTANAKSVKDTMLCTCLVNEDDVRLSTVEHINSALYALGIDNLIIEIDAPEIPIMDGSSSPFIFLLLEAGIKELNKPKKFIKIKENIRVESGDKWAEFKPYNGFKIDFTIDFSHPAIPASQQYVLDFTSNKYISEISRARTFGFMKDIDYLRSQGLCLGGSLDSAIVLDDYSVLNPGGLRYQDEFVRHKILDAFGDIFMAGHNIIGEMVAYKSGHGLNNMLLQSLMDKKSAWEMVTIEDGVSERRVEEILDISTGFSLA